MTQFLRLIFLFLALIPQIFTEEFSEVNVSLDPTLHITVLVHAYSKAKTLPFTLSAIESQNYDKSRIRIQLYFDLYECVNRRSFDPNIKEYSWNYDTYRVIQQWIKHNRNLYRDIDLIIDILDDNEGLDLANGELWTHDRFEKIMRIKQRAFVDAQFSWADFIAFIDADVFLTNSEVFKNFVTLDNEGPIAPMLYSLGMYSNFWAGMNSKHYYERSPDYSPILEREKLGTFQVPMIHTCVFINLRNLATRNLTYDASKVDGSPFDDIIAFALSAKLANIPLLIDNQQYWGYVMPSQDQTAIFEQQDLIDLQLEAIADVGEFPVSESLRQFINRPTTLDKLDFDEIYCINLERRAARKKKMAAIFSLLGIDVRFVPAVDGQRLNWEKLENMGVKTIPGYQDPYHKRPMTFGEIGCFLSHYNIWKEMIDRNLSKIIILEDDVRFKRNFRRNLATKLKFLENKWYTIDLVYLGRKPQGDDAEVQVGSDFVVPDYSYWTLGYILTTSGARKLLDARPLERLLPVDEFLPIMYDKSPHKDMVKHFETRNLVALSFSPAIIEPTHYVGDDEYLSDTESSKYIPVSSEHPKHSEL